MSGSNRSFGLCAWHGEQNCRQCDTRIFANSKCFPHSRKACEFCHPDFFGEQTPEKRFKRLQEAQERDLDEYERAQQRFYYLLVSFIAMGILIALWPKKIQESGG
jgi:hypothetical protein